MFAQKLITLFAIVLIFAIINIDAEDNNKSDKKDGQKRGGHGHGRGPRGPIAIISLCLNCPKAQTAIDAAKTCITDAGAGDAVTATAAITGEECFKQLFDTRDSVKSKADLDKLNKCGDTLKASGGDDLKDCFEAQKPARPGPGSEPGSGPGSGSGSSQNQNK